MDWRPSYRKLCRLLLRIYPAEFREEYGAEMDHAVAESAKVDGHLRLWSMLLGDAARSAPRESPASFFPKRRINASSKRIPSFG